MCEYSEKDIISNFYFTPKEIYINNEQYFKIISEIYLDRNKTIWFDTTGFKPIVLNVPETTRPKIVPKSCLLCDKKFEDDGKAHYFGRNLFTCNICADRLKRFKEG